MRTYKKTVSLILSACMMLAAGACTNDSASAAESELTTTAVTTEETTTFSGHPEYIVDPSDGFTIPFGDAMGFQNCYCTCELIAPYSFEWTMFNEDGEPIAYQFGSNEESPRFYPIDMDGDGQDEIISYSQYSADGICQVDIFRNNNGVVEIGSFTGSDTRGTMEYVPDTGEVIFHNWETEEDEQLGMSDFEFEEYVYES